MRRNSLNLLAEVAELARRPDTSPEIALLAAAILQLSKQATGLGSDNRDAFEQIQELDRRQGDGNN
jgi:hypothetical protein